MNPYYTDDYCTIYNETCLDTMKRMPDNHIDLTVTSPPYDDLRDYKGYDFDFEPTARELFRVTKQGGVVVWVVGDATVNGSETGTSFKQALYFMECGFNMETMIYEKNGPAYPSQNRYYSIFEYMFVFSKGKPKTTNLICDRKNKWVGQKWSNTRSRRDVTGELRKTTWEASQGGEYGIRFNIWKYNVGHGYSTKDECAYKHPAIYPEKLANDHIMSWSNPGDMVYDPFLGSGTTTKMAKHNNRKCIGSETTTEYCEIAVKRLQQEVLELTYQQEEENE